MIQALLMPSGEEPPSMEETVAETSAAAAARSSPAPQQLTTSSPPHQPRPPVGTSYPHQHLQRPASSSLSYSPITPRPPSDSHGEQGPLSQEIENFFRTPSGQQVLSPPSTNPKFKSRMMTLFPLREPPDPPQNRPANLQ